MLMLNSKKGDFGVGLIIVVIGLIFVLGGVLYFFFVFKAHATLEAREEYIWNKVQEVPLDLFSMDVDRESFVFRTNKIYYFGSDVEKNHFQDIMNDIVTDQILYGYEGCPPNCPIGYVILVDDITISEISKIPNCECTQMHATYCECSADCPKAGEPCGVEVPWGPFKKVVPEESKCYNTKIEFSAEFPFPLTFNGTEVLTDSIFYKVIGYV